MPNEGNFTDEYEGSNDTKWPRRVIDDIIDIIDQCQFVLESIVNDVVDFHNINVDSMFEPWVNHQLVSNTNDDDMNTINIDDLFSPWF